MTTDETLTYEALRYLALGPVANQRTLAAALGVSVGKANYVARALLAKGWVKLENVQRNPNRLGYLYVLTPRGVAEKGLVKLENVSRNPNRLGYLYVLTPRGAAEKARLTTRFLQRKLAEYDALQAEIDALAREAGVPDVRALAR